MESHKFVFCVDRRKAQQICDILGDGWEPRSLAQPLIALRIKAALVFDLRVLHYEKGLFIAEQWVAELQGRMAKGCEGMVFIQ